MIRISICDDDARHLKYTYNLVSRYMKGYVTELDCFSSPESLLSQVENGGYLPDIAILDIRLGRMDGIELARQLNRCAPGCCIIFLTGYSEYCSDVYGTEHIFFVVKSHAEQYLSVALDKALAYLDSHSADVISFTTHGTTVVLRVKQIVYIESSLRKLRIFTEKDSFETYGKIDDFLSEEQGELFVRCHQSFLINLRYVTGINSTGFILSSGELIPISRSRFGVSKERFFDFMRLNTTAPDSVTV